MSDISGVKALVFDVFGTVVDWRTSLINDFTKWGEANGHKADWTALVDGWRGDARPPPGNAGGDDHRSHGEPAALKEPRPAGVRRSAPQHFSAATSTRPSSSPRRIVVGSPGSIVAP